MGGPRCGLQADEIRDFKNLLWTWGVDPMAAGEVGKIFSST